VILIIQQKRKHLEAKGNARLLLLALPKNISKIKDKTPPWGPGNEAKSDPKVVPGREPEKGRAHR